MGRRPLEMVGGGRERRKYRFFPWEGEELLPASIEGQSSKQNGGGGFDFSPRPVSGQKSFKRKITKKIMS